MSTTSFQQFQPATGNTQGPKWVVAVIAVLILVMFISLLGFAIVVNQ